jgi:CRISPR/Cas system-associated exonuclease Cas4 (RecB family)
MDQLRKDFVFNPSNLQNYVDCPYRFYLKHVLNLAWPAPLTDDYLLLEKTLKHGQALHQLIFQQSIGMPIEWLYVCAEQEGVTEWWKNFHDFGMKAVEKEAQGFEDIHYYYEIPLQVELNGFRLSGVLDLLLVGMGEKACIFDWKSGGKTAYPKLREQLAARIQTQCYPLLVYLARHLPLDSHKIETVGMIYWFAGNPQLPIEFKYDKKELEALQDKFSCLLQQISQDVDFEKTAQTRHCITCSYRTYCERIDLAVAEEDRDLDEAVIESLEDDYNKSGDILEQ